MKQIVSKIMRGGLFLLAVSAVVVLSASALSDTDIARGEAVGRKSAITAAGATFPLPFYTEAFKTYWEKNDIPVTYAGIGTERGLQSLKQLQTDFAGVDVPPTAEERKLLPAETVLVPTALGAVEVVYNLQGVSNLRLTGELLADIYSGHITKWNDSRIAAVNPGVVLPDQSINPVFRLDGSGTTYIFSHYLSQVSAGWKTSVGVALLPKFPKGVGAKGSSGVASLVSKIPGGIGYVAAGYASTFEVSRALLKNAAGNFVSPTEQHITAAAASLAGGSSLLITNAPGADAYPISCFSFALLYKNQHYAERTRSQAEELVRMLVWLVSPEAQQIAVREHYAPLPVQVAARSMKLLDEVTYDGKKLNK